MLAFLDVSASKVSDSKGFTNFQEGVWENRYPTEDWICLGAFFRLYGQPQFELAAGAVLFEPNPEVTLGIYEALQRTKRSEERLPAISSDIAGRESVMYARVMPLLMRSIHKKANHGWNAEIVQGLEFELLDVNGHGGILDMATLLTCSDPDQPGKWSSFLPCFLELKPGKQEGKQIYQTLAEGLLSCKRNGHYDVPILGGLLTCDPPQVQLWCFVERNRVLVQVPLGLLSLETVEGVMRLTDLLAVWTSMVARRLEDRRRAPPETRFPKRSHTLLPDESEEKMVFKAYRKEDPAQAIKNNLDHFQGASTRAISDEFVVLQYPFIPAAKPFPTTNRDFSGVLQDLQKLGNASLVHGDVRLANMIFAENRSHLIDFDFCGIDGKSSYPTGYNLHLGDTLRHPELGGLR